MKNKLKILIPSALLIIQFVAICYARTVPTRYFCWAPFDMQTEYDARATVNGHQLTEKEFRARYRKPQHGGDNRSPQHVIDMLQQAEEKHAAMGDRSIIDMQYRVNGKELRHWHWPQTQPSS